MLFQLLVVSKSFGAIEDAFDILRAFSCWTFYFWVLFQLVVSLACIVAEILVTWQTERISFDVIVPFFVGSFPAVSLFIPIVIFMSPLCLLVAINLSTNQTNRINFDFNSTIQNRTILSQGGQQIFRQILLQRFLILHHNTAYYFWLCYEYFQKYSKNHKYYEFFGNF